MLRPHILRDLDPQQGRRLPLGQRLEPPAGPQRRPPGELIDQSPADTGVAPQLLDVGLGREESVGPAFDPEAVPPPGPDPSPPPAPPAPPPPLPPPPPKPP